MLEQVFKQKKSPSGKYLNNCTFKGGHIKCPPLFLNNIAMRIDKFLWCVRVYKTRGLATEDLKLGKISIDGIPVKPSREVKIGELLQIKKHGYAISIFVKDFPKSRVGAKLVPIYMEDQTPAEEHEKRDLLAMARNLTRDKGTGRPTKKDRRNLDEMGL
jgi:ribosome-associated heat shock protein Hsp15